MKFPDHWLVVRLSALGDVTLTTGVLNRWYQEYGWKFSFLTFSQWAPVLQGHPAIENVIGVSRDDMRPARMMRLFSNFSSELKGYGLLDLHGTLRSRLLRLIWSGTVCHYPKYSIERRIFLRSGKSIFRDKLLQYNVPQRYALAIDAVAPERSEVLPCIFMSESERAAAHDLLFPVGSAAMERKLVALHPYSTHPNKAWLAGNWQALASALSRAGHTVVVIGRGDTLITGLQGLHDFTNATSLRETCAILEACDVLVTGDSGPMHLAGGVGTPVVALFGPTHGVWGFYPEGQRDIVVESTEACRPCSLHGSKRCDKDQICMRSITPERVLQAVESVLLRS